jgi:hypothetical protein
MADLLSVIIGGAIALSGSFGAKVWEERRERAALRAAFKAEISTLLRMAAARGHDRLFRAAVELWERKGVEQTIVVFGAEDLPIDPVFSKNVDKIGKIGADIASDLGMFYALMAGIRLDLRALLRGQMQQLTPQARIDVIKRDLALYEEALLLGQQLVKRL